MRIALAVALFGLSLAALPASIADAGEQRLGISRSSAFVPHTERRLPADRIRVAFPRLHVRELRRGEVLTPKWHPRTIAAPQFELSVPRLTKRRVLYHRRKR